MMPIAEITREVAGYIGAIAHFKKECDWSFLDCANLRVCRSTGSLPAGCSLNEQARFVKRTVWDDSPFAADVAGARR